MSNRLHTAVPRLAAWSPGDWPLARDWQPVWDAFYGSVTGQRLAAFVQQRLAAGAVVYPPQPLRALALTALRAVRVVILGQDPYHGPGQAEGLAFSVPPGVKPPPSLRNIQKELQREGLATTLPAGGSLTAWAARGALLLNTTLTVEDGQPASHAKQGWESFTDALLTEVARRPLPCAYLLWGNLAQAKRGLIERAVTEAASTGGEALILCANHPSPLSALRPPAPFVGCGHFALAQRWLAERGQPFDWSLA